MTYKHIPQTRTFLVTIGTRRGGPKTLLTRAQMHRDMYSVDRYHGLSRKVQSVPVTVAAEVAKLIADPRRDCFLQGVCVALHVMASGGAENAWCELVRSVGPAQVFNYAYCIEPAEWGFGKFDTIGKSNFPDEWKKYPPCD